MHVFAMSNLEVLQLGRELDRDALLIGEEGVEVELLPLERRKLPVCFAFVPHGRRGGRVGRRAEGCWVMGREGFAR